MRISRLLRFSLLAFILAFFAAGLSAEEGIVTVYTHRHYEADQTIFDLFTARTGIKVRVLKGDADQLLQRLKAEGAKSPADLFITADVGRLWKAKEEGLLQSARGSAISAIPAHLRDAEGHWVGLTKRARVIVWDGVKSVSSPARNYLDLASPAMRGKVLIRSSGNVYNVSMTAALIGTYGDAGAASWAAGVAANLAQPPKGGDRDQMKALAAGVGGSSAVAVTNTYYLGQLLGSQDPAEREIGSRMRVVFPDQEGAGTHVNVSGAGIARHSPNREGARLLLEFMVSVEAQRLFAEANFEYPVLPGVPLHPFVAAWGSFKEDTQPLENLGRRSAGALALMDKAGWK
ncbi:MAG: iron(III) transport system substrate-binding protein [Spirochaetes bacterium]|nr:MAG: iron(III) transport system substrate-binding protein [Spirochaetota bacterium]